jgi:hypothetical protein
VKPSRRDKNGVALNEGDRARTQTASALVHYEPSHIRKAPEGSVGRIVLFTGEDDARVEIEIDGSIVHADYTPFQLVKF